MTLSAGRKLGPYEVVALIGAGGMGEVYKARDTRLDRIVAVKLLLAEVADRPDRRLRFEAEARASRSTIRTSARSSTSANRMAAPSS